MHYYITIIFLLICISCKKEAPIDYRDAYIGTYTCQLQQYQIRSNGNNVEYINYDSSNGIIQIAKHLQDSMVDFYFGEGLRLESDKLIINDLFIKPIGKEIKISHHIPFKIENNLKLTNLYNIYYSTDYIDSINPKTKTFNLFFVFAQIHSDYYYARITGTKN
ncbi:MAG: hypothetical protein IPK03_02680 [Bacteroidetes bacterium]|nr:hypothetical protein [Bacteroidota bacterium]